MANKLVLKRHTVVRHSIGQLVMWYFIAKYRAKIERKPEFSDRQFLFISNHQTGGDQFFVEQLANKHMYFIATEDIFSNGFTSKALKWLLGPIPIKKNATDLRAVKTSMRVAKEGGSIALFPEGNRTFSGATVYMKPAISKFAKSLKLPIAITIIDGGFGVQPRWSDCIRKGEIRTYVKRIIEPEEYQNMTDEELYNLIVSELAHDESSDGREYYSNKLAEYVERVLYICPDCGLSTIESNGDLITCKKCGKTLRYLPNKTLEPLGEAPKFKETEPLEYATTFNTLKDWYEYQEDYINKLKLDDFGDEEVIYQDIVSFSNVVLYKRKELIDGRAELRLYKDAIDVTVKGEVITLDFDDISVISILGKNKMQIYYKDLVYQIKGDKRFNPVKYMHFFYHYVNVTQGGENDKFLGL